MMQNTILTVSEKAMQWLLSIQLFGEVLPNPQSTHMCCSWRGYEYSVCLMINVTKLRYRRGESDVSTVFIVTHDLGASYVISALALPGAVTAWIRKGLPWDLNWTWYPVEFLSIRMHEASERKLGGSQFCVWNALESRTKMFATKSHKDRIPETTLKEASLCFDRLWSESMA